MMFFNLPQILFRISYKQLCIYNTYIEYLRTFISLCSLQSLVLIFTNCGGTNSIKMNSFSVFSKIVNKHFVTYKVLKMHEWFICWNKGYSFVVNYVQIQKTSIFYCYKRKHIQHMNRNQIQSCRIDDMSGIWDIDLLMDKKNSRISFWKI